MAKITTTEIVNGLTSRSGSLGIADQIRMTEDDSSKSVYNALTDLKEMLSWDYSNQYLTFEVLSAGTITMTADNNAVTGKTISYSTDDGTTWSSLTTTTSVKSFGSFNVGDKVLFKGTNNTFGNGSSSNSFGGTAKTKVYGNIMSLLYEDDFFCQTSLSGKNYAFRQLFYRCSGLTDASNLILPATTLANYCYSQMFQGCTSLTTAPELPATTLASNCYGDMFYDCTSLTTAPALPSTTLAPGCYNGMFYGCTSLVTAPALPATTLVHECYTTMFASCTSLTTAPELPATTLANYCYAFMFVDCSSLTYIKCLATNISAASCTENWVGGVSASGIFVQADNMTDWVNGYAGIPEGWDVYTESDLEEVKRYELDNIMDFVQSDYSGQYLTFEAITRGEINITSFNDDGIIISYSKDDGQTWTDLTVTAIGDSFGLFDIGDKLLIKSLNNNSTSYYFGGDAEVKVYGNIMSLLYGDGFLGKTTFPHGLDITFGGLFDSYTGLTDASNLILPATALVDSCYSAMFQGCTSLTTAPALPATTLAIGCYGRMFRGCTSLTIAPALPATTLASSCYGGMFSDCISLTTAPELPSTALAEGCYTDMFYGCTSLNYIKCSAMDISEDECTYEWVSDVSSTGVFVKSDRMGDWTIGNNGIPSGWTVYTESEYKPIRWGDKIDTVNIQNSAVTYDKIGQNAKDHFTDYELNEWVVNIQKSGGTWTSTDTSLEVIDFASYSHSGLVENYISEHHSSEGSKIMYQKVFLIDGGSLDNENLLDTISLVATIPTTSLGQLLTDRSFIITNGNTIVKNQTNGSGYYNTSITGLLGNRRDDYLTGNHEYIFLVPSAGTGATCTFSGLQYKKLSDIYAMLKGLTSV